MPLLPNTRRGCLVVLAASCHERRATVLAASDNAVPTPFDHDDDLGKHRAPTLARSVCPVVSVGDSSAASSLWTRRGSC
jgi:hypothetical protein